MIDTMNKFLVASQGERLVVMNARAMITGISPDDALLLAAYLVTMAEPRASHIFDEVREAVENC